LSSSNIFSNEKKRGKTPLNLSLLTKDTSHSNLGVNKNNFNTINIGLSGLNNNYNKVSDNKQYNGINETLNRLNNMFYSKQEQRKGSDLNEFNKYMDSNYRTIAEKKPYEFKPLNLNFQTKLHNNNNSANKVIKELSYLS
jgi:hypothetical protein